MKQQLAQRTDGKWVAVNEEKTFLEKIEPSHWVLLAAIVAFVASAAL